MIWINGFWWQVLFTYDAYFLTRPDGVVTFGATDRERNCIYVYAGLNERMGRKVLKHELAHAFLHSYGFRFPEEQEEAFCSFFDSYAEDILRTANKLYYDNIRTVK